MQQRLQEAPRRHERVQITHRLPQLERPQHVAVDVDVARQVRIGELDLIKTGDGAHRVPVLQPDTEARRALTEASGLRHQGNTISNGTSVLANARAMRSSQNPPRVPPVHGKRYSACRTVASSDIATASQLPIPSRRTDSPAADQPKELRRQLEYDRAASQMLSTPRTRVPDGLHLKRAGKVRGKSTSLQRLAPG